MNEWFLKAYTKTRERLDLLDQIQAGALRRADCAGRDFRWLPPMAWSSHCFCDVLRRELQADLDDMQTALDAVSTA